MATINGTFNSLIAGTLSGTVATPGAQGPAGPAGSQGPAGAPGVGVPAGGLTGQILSKASGTSYDTAWTTLTPGATESWVTTNFLSKAGNLAGLTNLATARDNLQLGTLNSPTFAGVTVQGAGANVANLGATYLTLNQVGHGQFTIQPSQGIVFPDASIQTTAFPAGSDMPTGGSTGQSLVKVSNSNYDADWATIAGLPASGTVGQVLTKNSGTSYDASWATLIPGDRYLTSSTTSNSVSNGNKTFTIGTGLSYTPTQNITISYDSSHHMHGEVLTYNSSTGLLTVDINNHTGTGTYAVWTVNVGGVTPATSVAWGAITGTLGNQTDLDTALNAKLEITDAASTYQTISGMSSYLSKAGNLAGLASTSTARTNLGLGTISTFNDAPSNGSTYGRQNGAWVVAGGGSLPTVQIASSTINPFYIDCTPVPHCLALAYPSKTEILNGIFATGFSYTNDPDSNPALTLTGLTSMTVAYVNNNQQMTSGPNFTNCTSLVNVNVSENDAMVSPPNFTGCSSLTTVTMDSNGAMTTAPNFTGCTSLVSVSITWGPMATSPSFNGFTSLTTLTLSGTTSTQAPNLTGCASISSVNLSQCFITSSNLLAMCVQIYNSGSINGYLNMIGDFMPYFDGQALPYQITDLQSAGWTVEFNDSNPP